MIFKGTKGDWRVGEPEPVNRIGLGTTTKILSGYRLNEKVVARVLGTQKPSNQANAKLIAAAPELLAALQEVLIDERDYKNCTELSVATRAKIENLIRKTL